MYYTKKYLINTINKCGIIIEKCLSSSCSLENLNKIVLQIIIKLFHDDIFNLRDTEEFNECFKKLDKLIDKCRSM